MIHVSPIRRRGSLFALSTVCAFAFAGVACSASDGGTQTQAPTVQAGTNDAAAPAADSGASTPPPRTTPDSGSPPITVTSDAAAKDADAAEAATVLPSICTYDGTTPIPYDHTRGLVEEYALELSMSCEVGGYLAPLIDADPINLAEVTKFNAALADWLRATILLCSDATTSAPKDAFLLLPAASASSVTRADFDAAIALMFVVLGRHDNQPDGLSVARKAEIKARLQSLAPTVVKNASAGNSKRLVSPECAVPVDAGTSG